MSGWVGESTHAHTYTYITYVYTIHTHTSAHAPLAFLHSQRLWPASALTHSLVLQARDAVSAKTKAVSEAVSAKTKAVRVPLYAYV